MLGLARDYLTGVTYAYSPRAVFKVSNWPNLHVLNSLDRASPRDTRRVADVPRERKIPRSQGLFKGQ